MKCVRKRRDEMSSKRPRRTPEQMRAQILAAAAKSFLMNGYTDTTLKHLSEAADVNIGSLMNIFKSKEDILCELVKFVIEKQFEVTGKILNGVTDDKMLFYAAETVLQLHIVELNENLRDLYGAAYSLPKPSAILQRTVTGKLENIFKEHLPDLETKDFYKLEIATGGIMRGYMTIPCDMWFTMDQKVEAFLENTFLIYEVPKEKINEAIAFVKKFDFDRIAKETIDSILSQLSEVTQKM